MNALNRALARTIEPTKRSCRKDLLGLASRPEHPALLTGCRATTQWLTDLGFRIDHRCPGHWVLTHSHPLPQLHFYSEEELARFASGRAQAYAKRILRETRP
ncbi:MAG: hypothetical protein ACQEV6_13370 [Pseudomonadota bacterium]